MDTYVMLTRLGLEVHEAPDQYQRLAEQLNQEIDREELDVEWLANFVVEEMCDYIDIFQAREPKTAERIAELTRRLGHAEISLWPVVDWQVFKKRLAPVLSCIQA